MRRRAHRNLAREGIEVLEVFVGRFLDEALLPRVVRNAESAPRVRDAQEDGAQAGFLRGAGHGEVQLVRVLVRLSRCVAVQVMEFAYRGDAGPRHLQETELRDGVEIVGREPLGGRIHGLAPAPEVVAGVASMLGAPADCALERMAVGGHQARQERAPAHRGDFGLLRRLPDTEHDPVADDQGRPRVDAAARKEEIRKEGAHGGRDVASSAEKSHIGTATPDRALCSIHGPSQELL